jgi:hypothetical protein
LMDFWEITEVMLNFESNSGLPDFRFQLDTIYGLVSYNVYIVIGFDSLYPGISWPIVNFKSGNPDRM